jgi:ATP-binding cassette subfamily C exporter for protease/lipase
VSLIRNLQFALMPGSVLMVMGPSGAGKTTLARLLVGLLACTQGKIRLDGADISRWRKDELGPSVGYLPQGIELLEGTVADNIARFAQPQPDKLQQAIDLAGLTELLEQLPQGLQTPVGVQGAFLSGGMRQRIALARAVYGQPALVVLDEPNSHLDSAGEQALARCLQQLREGGSTVVVISHRQSVLEQATHLMVVREGVMQACGARDEVIQALKKAYQQQAAAPGGGRAA